jgi:hypothetical protein
MLVLRCVVSIKFRSFFVRVVMVVVVVKACLCMMNILCA